MQCKHAVQPGRRRRYKIAEAFRGLSHIGRGPNKVSLRHKNKRILEGPEDRSAFPAILKLDSSDKLHGG